MRSALLVLALYCLFPLVYGACFQSRLAKGVTHCQDETDQSWHVVGSSWTNSKCVECSCGSKIMSCCDSLATVTDYPDDCIVKYSYEECTFEVVKKDDPSENCHFSAILK